MTKIGRNDLCYCGSGKKFKKCHMGKVIEIGVLRSAYSWKDGDDFYSRFLLGLGQIRSCVYDKNRQNEYDKSFMPIFQNLQEMRLVKDKCSDLIEKHNLAIKNGEEGRYHGNQIDILNPIDDELNIFFKDFFIRGQMAIEALIKHSIYMGLGIGFLFTDNDKKFRSGLKNFILMENDNRFVALAAFVNEHKDNWYLSFREMRRKIEHEGWVLPPIKYTLSDGFKTVFTLPKYQDDFSIMEALEMLWKSMNYFCEEVIVFLLSLKLNQEYIIVFVPEEKRDKNLPVKYMVCLKEMPGVPLNCG